MYSDKFSSTRVPVSALFLEWSRIIKYVSLAPFTKYSLLPFCTNGSLPWKLFCAFFPAFHLRLNLSNYSIQESDGLLSLFV